MFQGIVHQISAAVTTLFVAASFVLPAPFIMPEPDTSGEGEIGEQIDGLIDEDISSKISSGGAIVIDFETGEDIYAYNADELCASGSMAKMMSVYLVYQAIENGQIGYDTIVPISAGVEVFSHDEDVSNIPLFQSGTYTVDELLSITIVSSASGAINAMAELVGGSRQEFIRMMNDKVAEWGIDAYFETTYGGGPTTQVTPRAMAVIVRNTISQFPQVLEKTSMPTYEFGYRKLTSTNKLLSVYDGIDGYKTGTFDDDFKENFAATAERDGTRIISVTMSSRSGRRFHDTTVLLDYGFAVMEERLEAARIEEERLEAARLEEARAEEERFNEMRVEEALLEEQMRREWTEQEKARIEEETRLEAERLEDEREKDENARRDNIITVIVCIGLTFMIAGTGALFYRKKVFVNEKTQ